jgi:hypothetical protein
VPTRTFPMPLPPLKYTTAHLALTVPVDEPVLRNDEVKQQLAASLSAEFQARGDVVLPDGAPDEAPYLLLHGRASQIAFSRVQADYEIEFYDVYQSSVNLCREFVAEKMEALLRAWTRVGAHPVWEGLVLTLRASTLGQDESPIRHMLETHLRPDLADDALHDVNLQLGLRLQEQYFVTLRIGKYEARRVQRQVAPGTPVGPIRPWEGEVADEGFELTVDINNRLGALIEKKHTRVDEGSLRALNDLAWQLVEHVAVPLAHDGVLDLTAIQQATV